MDKDNTSDGVDGGSGELVVPDQALPDKLYLLPIAERPFFPGQVQPVVVDAGEWEETLRRVSKTGHNCVGLVYVGDRDPDRASFDDLAELGTVVRIHNVAKQQGALQFIAQGIKRCRVIARLSSQQPFLAQVDYPSSTAPASEADQVRAYAMALLKAIKELLPLNPLYPEELKQ